MAITVNKLYSNSGSLYKMKLLAGHKGLNNLVEWVHIVEDPEVNLYLHGQELIFTAGYMNRDDKWLLEFTKGIHSMQASAFVINIGPYIHTIPTEVIQFCDEVELPLFTIPWKTRMVDMTRDFCTRIMHNENVEASIATTLKNILFHTGDREQQIQQMERYGYPPSSYFCFISITLESRNKEYYSENLERLRYHVERAARAVQRQFLSFSYQSDLIVVLSESEERKVRLFIENLLKQLKMDKDLYRVFTGVSPVVQGYGNLDENFEKGVSANQMAVNQKKEAVFYEDLDVHKILLAVKQKKILRDFYTEVMGKLESYDKENDTNLVEFLKIYLDSNGSQQTVASQQFIHRNTVNNQIRKIEKITGRNLLDLDERVRCYLAFMIKDFL